MRRLAWITAALALLAALAIGLRVASLQSELPLSVWHTHAPEEPDAAALDGMDWGGYLQAEARLFDTLRAHLRERLEADERSPANRYFEASPLHSGRMAVDWNRSQVLEPTGAPRGAVLLLHGLTDSPYSMRHIAQHYRERGWVAIVPRLPAHGTVPGALTAIEWTDWSAAVRLAAREARRRIAQVQPLHIVGYSNGGALALQYVLDAQDDPRLAQAQRVVLVAPMIGVTAFARFAGVLGWPAVVPAFAHAAWLNVVPEYNPFKYNSFPVNAARQSSLLTRALQARIAERARDGRLAALPPLLCFQSIVDHTVSTQAVVDALFAQLPANGSELVIFDINRRAAVSPLLRSSVQTALERIVAPAPRPYGLTLIANEARDADRVVERRTPAHAREETLRALELRYPVALFSLSHIALPFPPSDGLYGAQPAAGDDFGVQLGTLSPRGEAGVLIVGLDTLTRASSNPFFPYLLERIDRGIDDAVPPR
jgi:alpha-beta hydrolase superfamily lysophospholipase